MIIYPAIDIRGGQCVRLVEGDFGRQSIYDANPADAARRWAEAGARWLHVVDLDGAVSGRTVNQQSVAAIREAVDLPIQLGGGLRSLETIEYVLGSGIDRVILGTVALQNPELVTQAVRRWGSSIAVGLDARNGRLATDGWLGQSEALAVDVARKLAEAGVLHFIFTDISRDGTLSGLNLASLGELVAAAEANVIASGGVATLDDIRGAAGVGADGVIIGRAIYDGRIDLVEALAVADAIGVSS